MTILMKLDDGRKVLNLNTCLFLFADKYTTVNIWKHPTEGENIEIVCKVLSNRSVYNWSVLRDRHNVYINNSKKYSLHGNHNEMLKIFNVTKEDIGVYICTSEDNNHTYNEYLLQVKCKCNSKNTNIRENPGLS